jgi:hypothetical protein
MTKWASGAVDLEALDPVTGAALADQDSAEPQSASPPSPKAAWLRRISVMLVVLSFLSAVGAIYCGTTIASLQSIEHTWRLAMAVDDARQGADQFVIETSRKYGGLLDDEDGPMALLGVEEIKILKGYERDLQKQVVPDGNVRDLRDAMITAMAFRRLQLQPARLEIGDSPMKRVERDLAAQLDRWNLTPAPKPDPPTLVAVAAAHTALKRFADKTTNAVVLATMGTRLVSINVDASRIDEVATLDAVPDDLLVTDDLAVAVVGGRAIAFALPAGPKVWDLPAARAVRAVERGMVWLETKEGVTKFDRSGNRHAPPVALPTHTRMVADTASGLVLTTNAASSDRQASGGLVVWDPATSKPVAAFTSSDARFVAASEHFVAFQRGDSLAVQPASGANAVDLLLPRVDAGYGAFSPNERVVAFAGGSPASDGAVVMRYSRLQQQFLGLQGPATMFDRAPAWSPSGSHLFWATRDGRIAILDANTDRAQVLRTELSSVDFIAVTVAR